MSKPNASQAPLALTLDSITPVHHPSVSVEPPRKRQRTTPALPSPPAARGTSPAPIPTASACASSGPSTLSRSPSSQSLHTQYMSLAGGAPDAHAGASGLSRSGEVGRSDAARLVSGGSSAGAETSCAAGQAGSLPNTGTVGMEGGAKGSGAGMKGARGSKGKAREGASIIVPRTDQASRDGSIMVWESEGACSIDDRSRGTEHGSCDHKHAAGGASSFAKSPVVVMSAVAHADEDVPVRDGEYYIEGADCVIRVENTLFRVHRYFLGRDSSAFQHMFSIPVDAVPSYSIEGCSDENPIRLYGESVERFRALLSVIYDLPPQLQAYNTPAANVERLLTIAEMTNKYHFASIEAWAVDALYNVISGLHGPPQPAYELSHCSSAWMKRLLEVALLCGHAPLRKYVAERWVERIVARDLRPVHALEIADRSGIRRLLGYAYYVQLLEMGDDFDPGVVEDGKQYARSRLGNTATATATALAATGPGGEANADGNVNVNVNLNSNANANARNPSAAVLTRSQKQRLLSGHWSLTRLWEHLRLNPPTFQRPDGCTYHQHGCLATWTTVWREVSKSESTLRHRGADVLGRLKAMEEQLFMHADLSCALTPQCKRGALLALKATIKDVQEGLADRFVDLCAGVEVGSDLGSDSSTS